MNGPVRHCWLPRSPRGEGITLLCFPYAGARWTVFRDWEDELPASAIVAPVDYPRDPKSGAVCFRQVADLVDAAFAAVNPTLPDRVALYGHSLGAVVAFEFARRLAQSGREPLGVFVSGRSAPGAVRSEPAIGDLSPGAFQEKVLSWGGFSRTIERDSQLLEYFTGALRADMELAESYRPLLRPQLSCPLVAFSALDDRIAPPLSVWAWAEATKGDYRHDILPGDHFFPFKNRPQFLGLLGLRLTEMSA